MVTHTHLPGYKTHPSSFVFKIQGGRKSASYNPENTVLHGPEHRNNTRAVHTHTHTHSSARCRYVTDVYLPCEQQHKKIMKGRTYI